MIYQLMRRDPAWKRVPVVTSASAALFLIWHFAGPIAPVHTINLIFMPGLCFLLVFAGLSVSEQLNDSRFEATLPISVREIYAARVWSVMALLWLPVLTSACVVLFFPDAGNAAQLLVLMQLASAYMVVLLAFQSAGMRGFAIPQYAIIVPVFVMLPFSSAVDRSVVGWPFSGGTAVALFLLCCGIAATALFLRTMCTVPKSILLAPLSKTRESNSRVSDRRTSAFKPVLWSLFPKGGLVILVLFVQMASSSAFFGCIFVTFAWMAIRQQTRWMATLPVSTRALFAAIVAPMLIALTGGYALGIHDSFNPRRGGVDIRITSSQAPSAMRRTEDRADCKMPNIRPPLDYWVPVKAGQAPPIQAPWGEMFRPPVGRVAGFDVLNPYAVGCANSRRFFDWQFARATAATYGRPISRAEYERLDGELRLSTMVITRPRMLMVNIAVIVGLALLFLLVAMLNDWYHFRRLSLDVRYTLLTGGAALLVGIVVLNSSMWDIAQWLSWTLPDNSFVAMAALATPLVLLYMVAEKLFREAESSGNQKTA